MTIKERFELFDRENPHVYAHFVNFARKARNAGFKSYSSKAIIERIRWHLNVETVRHDEFKINNNYTAYYARKMMQEFPEYKFFFVTREVRS